MIQSVNSVPAFDIKQQYASIEAETSIAVLEVLASGRYIGGQQWKVLKNSLLLIITQMNV